MRHTELFAVDAIFSGLSGELGCARALTVAISVDFRGISPDLAADSGLGNLLLIKKPPEGGGFPGIFMPSCVLDSHGGENHGT
jgi:hypothetical protein